MPRAITIPYYTMRDIYESHGKILQLEIVIGENYLNKKIKKPEVHRPGLVLAGYNPKFISSHLLIFGKMELRYIKQLDKKVMLDRLDKLFSDKTPGVVVTMPNPPKEIISICKKKKIPVFKSYLPTMTLITQILIVLNDEFSPATTIHGTLVEVFGIGMLIQGDSSIGKSETALGLLERGHRLISDDVVKIKRKDGKFLIGSGPKLTRHLMEIRGMGILNVAHLYGAVCVRPDKSVDILVKLEEWDNNKFYDRVGLGDKFYDILGVDVPFYILPVKPGRDVILLIETLALQFRLKDMGYHSAKEFQTKLLATIASKKKKKIKSEVS
jgi:HPr kinase/phosphorylase